MQRLNVSNVHAKKLIIISIRTAQEYGFSPLTTQFSIESKDNILRIKMGMWMKLYAKGRIIITTSWNNNKSKYTVSARGPLNYDCARRDGRIEF